MDRSGMAEAEDQIKKVRKPYTITKPRESWTQPEHDKFLEALHLFDRDWKKIEAFVGSKTVIQIRSHAQKYFLKVQKNGTGEHLPPPRPKRKASRPYPRIAPIKALVLSESPGSYVSTTSSLLETGYLLRPDSSSVQKNQIVAAASCSWISNLSKGPMLTSNCCGSSESTPRIKPWGDMSGFGHNSHPLKVLPDFAQVYSFIGSVFDPNVSGHLRKLRKMDPIDIETVLLLMTNLAINLTNPDFDDHMRLLSSNEMGTADAMDASALLNDMVPSIEECCFGII